MRLVLSAVVFVLATSCGLTGCRTGRSAPPAPLNPRSVANPDAAFFFDELARHGVWTDTRQYGPCWYPSGVAADWRPYTVGRWLYTEEHGWLWASSEPWGWATDHYGRWTFLDSHGWVWVPGKAWSPAWVAWRTGGGLVGWAPLPPVPFDPLATSVPTVSQEQIEQIPPAAYVFVPAAKLTATDPRQHAEPLTRNLTSIYLTDDVTAYEEVEGRLVNRGPSVETIEEAIGEPVMRHKVTEMRTPGAAKVSGQEVAVYSPRVLATPRLRLPPMTREVNPALMAEERLRLEQHHQKLRAEMTARQEEEQPVNGESRATLRERHEREREAFEEQRQREVEATRRRQREERVRASEPRDPRRAARGDDPPAEEPTTKPGYEIPPEWQLPPELMEPPPRRRR